MIPNLFQPQKVHAMSALWLLPVTFIVYYFAFKFAITKFNLKTPGRDDEGEIKLMSKKEYNEIKNSGKDEANVSSAPEDALEVRIIEALGGADNIETVTCCASRLRVTVKDDSLIAPDTSWEKLSGGYRRCTRKELCSGNIWCSCSKYYNKSKGLSAFRLTIIEEMRKWQPLQEESV